MQSQLSLDTLPVDVAHHSALVERLYVAFEALDIDTMASCYADDAVFADPVFRLRGKEQIAAMWRMLAANIRQRGRDSFRLDFGQVQVEAVNGRAHWEAWYRFGPKGRAVHNVIDARFKFRDGLIAEHRDRFDFWAWSRQALGLAGVLLGWSPWLRRRVRAQAAARLAAFIDREQAEREEAARARR